jgi:hypothetical protein
MMPQPTEQGQMVLVSVAPAIFDFSLWRQQERGAQSERRTSCDFENSRLVTLIKHSFSENNYNLA